jgi:hypothetical protein
MSCAPYSATFDRRSWHVYPPGNSAAAASLICRTGEAQQSAATKIVVFNMTSPYFLDAISIRGVCSSAKAIARAKDFKCRDCDLDG